MSILLLLLNIFALLSALFVGTRKNRKIKLLSSELDKLKSSFDLLELEHNKLAVFLHTVQKERDQFKNTNQELNQIIHSLQLNIQQLEANRQSIIDAFNTYKQQTVQRIQQDLESVQSSNEALKEKYTKLLAEQEEKFAVVIDLTKHRTVNYK
ncbi:MAG TPA: hypothetical protein ENK52_04540 [Saprospiraceae bacterium]|nr:hypothetical protein [Saprospiraceae bacterium]